MSGHAQPVAMGKWKRFPTWAAFKVRLQGAKEKCGSPPYSEHSSALKMAASIGGCHLHLKEQLSLAEKAFQNGSLHMGAAICKNNSDWLDRWPF